MGKEVDHWRTWGWSLSRTTLITHNFKLNLISYRDKNCFVPDCKHVYFCCKVGHFNMGIYGDWLSFWASPKWPFEELQLLALLHELHLSASEVAAWFCPSFVLRRTGRDSLIHASYFLVCERSSQVDLYCRLYECTIVFYLCGSHGALCFFNSGHHYSL